MNNGDVAAVLTEIGELLELRNESSFRIRAYQNAAKTIGNLPVDVRELAAAGELTEIPGVGKALAEKIDELLATGRLKYLEDLRAEFPPGVRTLLNIPGVGPSLARRVYSELGIATLDELRAAAEDGRLAGLKGMGEKTAQNVLRGLNRVNKRDTRIPLNVAVSLVEELIDRLVDNPSIQNLTAAGSLRRWSPSIGDIDLIATSHDPERAMDAFLALPQVRDVLAHGPTKSAIISDNGLQVDFRIVEAEAYGSLLQHFTGNRDHNIQLREFALRRGLSLNEYGITRIATGDRAKYADEAAFYGALGLDWIPPELREGSGEIEAASAGRLPRLVTVDEIRGDLHVHTEWSDGSATIGEMVLAARERGYEYVAITDHSPSVGVAGGLAVDRLLEQIQQIRQAEREIGGITVLAGSEVDIKRDGSLDYPDEVLAKLDWVIASVHSGFNASEEHMTARIIRAIENPNVDAIGHPTGRLIGKREPYAVDLEAVFRAAARTGTVLEVSSQPARFDLSDRQARRAIELGVKLVVDTDAHAPVQYDLIRYGVEMARRAWAQAPDVLNTLPLSELRAALKSGAPSP